MTIKETILRFYEPLRNDRNHRYKSWEHCYSYFLKPQIDLDYACLHLAFYLASWGMYRGSSDLLKKDYLIHRDLASHLHLNRHLANITSAQNIKAIGTEKLINEIFGLVKFIKEYYKSSMEFFGEEKRSKSFVATDTLITKILLGTHGCIPAYDRFFIDGIRKEKIGFSSLSPSNLKKVIQFYLSNHEEIDQAGQVIKLDCGIQYPPMKLVDMYFWSVGKQNV